MPRAGNRHLRQLLLVGALAVIRRARQLGYTRPLAEVKLMERCHQGRIHHSKQVATVRSLRLVCANRTLAKKTRTGV